MVQKIVLGYNEFVKLRNKSLIPKMSSDTHESGVQVIGDGVTKAWQGFTYGESYYRSSINGVPSYITVKFPSDVKFNSLIIANGVFEADNATKSVNVKYLNNEGVFVEWVHENGLRYSDIVQYITKESISTTEIRFYGERFGNNSWGFRELNFLHIVDSTVLIKKDNQYGYYTDSFQSLGTTYPTKEQFEQYGMSDLSILQPGDVPVEYEMELISETDEEKCFSYSFDLNGQHKNTKSIDSIITE